MFRSWKIVWRALRSVWRFPLRSMLTIVSAVLGVAGAVTSINYALGGRAKVTGQLEGLGTNMLTVTPEQSRAIAGRERTGTIVTTLVPADYEALRRQVPGIVYGSPWFSGTYAVKAGDLTKKSCVVQGIETQYLDIKHWRPATGDVFQASDVRSMGRVALLGAGVARDLFGSAPAVGERILINRIPFTVAAVLTERGQSLDANNEDDQIYVPLTTAMHRLTNVNYYSGILFGVNRWENMDRTAVEANAVLAQRHRRVGKLAPDFQVQNQKRLLDTQIAASSQLLFFVRWIGVSALGVSGLGILAIAWIGVRERTREIGTRRALGATRGDIFVQVIFESLALSIAGCVLGVAAALGSSAMLAKWAAQPRVFDVPSAWIAMGCAAILNLLFAALPARAAAVLDPIEALRFE